MITIDNCYFYFLFVSSLIVISTAQNFWKLTQFDKDVPKDTRIPIIWCTVNPSEQQKCLNFAMANERDQIRVGYDYFKVGCRRAYSKDECMELIDEEKATLTTMDAGEVFVAGRYHSLIPISQEVLDGGLRHYYAVAVVKKSTTDINSLWEFQNKKACFAGVETFAGWMLPIYTLMKEGGMNIFDCNNHVKTAANYFGPSCAVNCLTDKYNPIGDNSDKMCQLCIGKIPGGRCTDSDPYAGYEGAFRCLLEAGDVAFLKHSTISELVTGNEFFGVSKDSFELICKDGSRRPIDEYLQCNWGKVPSDAVVTTSASSYEDRKKYQLFLEKASHLYGRQDGLNRGPNYNRDQNSRDNIHDGKQPDYDQFGNRVSRFKRQNFATPSYQDPYNNIPYDPYNRPNEPRNPNDPFDSNGRTTDRYGLDQFGKNNQYGDQFGHRTGDQSGSRPGDRQNDPFARDPYSINRDQYGVNIDPYDTDPTKHINRDNDPDRFNYNYNGVSPSPDERNRTNITFYEEFHLFESTPRYGIHANLMFQDAAVTLFSLPENLQTYSNFLGNSMDVIMGIRDCPVNKMTLCVTSDAENEKCVKMRTALKAQLLKPEMNCYKAHSQINCMQAIEGGSADVAVLDASDVYTAGLTFNLVPFISEVYNLADAEYYVVAVAKESDPDTELTYLRGKYTCHGGINTAAGWVYPLAFLISNGWIRPYGCNSIRAAAEYFSKSCVPGALSTEYNTGVPYDNMCHLCHGSSFRYCRRDASEDYYGHTGAFRCLVEGGGHVAFVKHTTVTENTGGKKKEWWTRDNLNDDYEILCTDGTRKEINEYEKCNLGKVKANAIVTRGGYGYNETQINAYINLFLYAQTFYGRKTTDEFSFSMFSSPPPYSDLIFQDATTQLKVIEPSKRYYSTYLGSDFMRARRIVDCHAGSSSASVSLFTLTLSAVVAILIVRN